MHHELVQPDAIYREKNMCTEGEIWTWILTIPTLFMTNKRFTIVKCNNVCLHFHDCRLYSHSWTSNPFYFCFMSRIEDVNLQKDLPQLPSLFCAWCPYWLLTIEFTVTILPYFKVKKVDHIAITGNLFTSLSMFFLFLPITFTPWNGSSCHACVQTSATKLELSAVLRVKCILLFIHSGWELCSTGATHRLARVCFHRPSTRRLLAYAVISSSRRRGGPNTVVHDAAIVNAWWRLAESVHWEPRSR